MKTSDDSSMTYDEHRIVSLDILDRTKDLTIFTFKIICEGIMNVPQTNLEEIRFTLVSFHPLADSFFLGNFAEHGRYENLCICPYTRIFSNLEK